MISGSSTNKKYSGRNLNSRLEQEGGRGGKWNAMGSRSGQGRLLINTRSNSSIGKTISLKSSSAPLPINTPSLKMQNNGQDVSIKLTTGSGGWGSSSRAEGDEENESSQENQKAVEVAPVKATPWGAPPPSTKVETTDVKVEMGWGDEMEEYDAARQEADAAKQLQAEFPDLKETSERQNTKPVVNAWGVRHTCEERGGIDLFSNSRSSGISLMDERRRSESFSETKHEPSFGSGSFSERERDYHKGRKLYTSGSSNVVAASGDARFRSESGGSGEFSNRYSGGNRFSTYRSNEAEAPPPPVEPTKKIIIASNTTRKSFDETSPAPVITDIDDAEQRQLMIKIAADKAARKREEDEIALNIQKSRALAKLNALEAKRNEEGEKAKKLYNPKTNKYEEQVENKAPTFNNKFSSIVSRTKEENSLVKTKASSFESDGTPSSSSSNNNSKEKKNDKFKEKKLKVTEIKKNNNSIIVRAGDSIISIPPSMPVDGSNKVKEETSPLETSSNTPKNKKAKYTAEERKIHQAAKAASNKKDYKKDVNNKSESVKKDVDITPNPVVAPISPIFSSVPVPSLPIPVIVESLDNKKDEIKKSSKFPRKEKASVDEKKVVLCKYGSGCRNGSNCKFLHNVPLAVKEIVKHDEVIKESESELNLISMVNDILDDEDEPTNETTNVIGGNRKKF